MTKIEIDTAKQPGPGLGAFRWPLLVFATAVLMGLPTLQGSFVGGDDFRLVLNHVLVNHPSLAHAIELFKIIHRDLYQPLPMLSFSLEFALGDALNLFEEGWEGGAWLFHLTNIILHGLNAAAVWCVIAMLQQRNRGTGGVAHQGQSYGVATIAAMLFAVHPLQVEVVAWVNGRMMLLSTLFAVASLITLGLWLGKGKHRWAVLTVVFTLFCAISKIRVALPLLLVIVPLAQGRKIRRPFVVLWVVCTAVTAAFAYVNLGATAQSGIFEGAEEKLHGPGIVRGLLALSWYFRHFLWPTGLASWYPAPGTVRWSDPATLHALIVTVVTVAVMAWLAWRSRLAALGFAWFFVSIASTVQIVPTRNALAADRYMYLPIIGLVWVVGVGLAAAYKWAGRRWTQDAAWGIALVIAAPAVIAMVVVSWYTASFYETPLKKSKRIAELNPITAHVWERVAWAYYRADRYEDAIAFGQKEFGHDDMNAQGMALQVIGMSQLHLGQHDDALASLNRAMELDPESATAKHRMALALYELGRIPDALPLLEYAVEQAPMKNPWIIRLALLYRKTGRPKDAQAMYKQAILNNRYEVPATLGMAELAIESGTQEGYLAAERDLLKLLEWMPENVKARVNLGVAYNMLGRMQKAIEAYSTALEYDSSNTTAVLNLASMYLMTGDVGKAGRFFESAASMGLESVDRLEVIHDFLIGQQAPQQAVGLWGEFLTRQPGSLDGRAYLAWSRALAGDLERARAEAEVLARANVSNPVVSAMLAYVALADGRYDAAVVQTETLCTMGRQGASARRRLLGAFAAIVRDKPDLPWSFCLPARLYLGDGHIDNAKSFIDLCDDQCRDTTCAQYVRSLRANLPG